MSPALLPQRIQPPLPSQPLLGLNISLKTESVDFLSQGKIISEGNVLIFFFSVKNRKGERRLKHAHRISIVEFEKNPDGSRPQLVPIRITAQPITDTDRILFATEKGVYVIKIKEINRAALNYPITADLVYPFDRRFGEISNIDIIDLTKKPRRIVDREGKIALVKSGDYELTINFFDSVTKKMAVKRADIDFRIRQSKVFGLFQLLLANPRMDRATRLQAISYLQKEIEASGLQQEQLEAQSRESMQNPLIYSALMNMAQRSNLQERKDLLEELKKMSAESEKTRREFLADNAPDSYWNEIYQASLNGTNDVGTEQNIAAYIGMSVKKSERYNTLPSHETFRGKLFLGIDTIWDLVANKYTIGTLAAIIAGTTTLGNYYPDSVAGPMHQWMVRVASHVYDSILNSSLLPYFTKPEELRKSVDFIINSGYLKEWIAGTALMSFGVYFSVHWLAYGWAQAKYWTGKGNKIPFQMEAMAKELFTIMGNFYLKINQMLKIPFFIARQKNLYPALDAGVTPFNKGLWNSPNATNETITNNARGVNKSTEDVAVLKSIAQRFAALMIVERRRGIPAAVLLRQEETGAQNLLNIVSKSPMEELARILDLTEVFFYATQELSRNQKYTLSKDDLNHSIKLYETIAQQLTTESEQNSVRKAKLLNWLMHHINNFTLTYLIGHKAHVFAQANKEHVKDLPSGVVNRARASIKMDFNATFIIWGWAAAEDFAPSEPGRLIDIHPRVYTENGQQLALYLGQTPTGDYLQNALKARGSNTYTWNTDEIMKELPFKRKQTVIEAMTAMLKALIIPDPSAEGKNLLETWAQWIANIKSGIWVRLTFAAVPLFFAFTADAENLHLSYKWIPLIALGTAITIITSKMGIQYSFINNKLTFGYATVWPFIDYTTGANEAHINANKASGQEAVRLILNGVSTNDIKTTQKGVRALKELYKRGNKELPDELNIPSDKYNHHLALAFINHANNDPPLPTEHSQTAYDLLNLGYASTLSTILFNVIQKYYFQKGTVVGIKDIAFMLGWLVVTYHGLKLTSKYLVKPAYGWAHKKFIGKAKVHFGNFMGSCSTIFRGRKPINLE